MILTATNKRFTAVMLSSPVWSIGADDRLSFSVDFGFCHDNRGDRLALYSLPSWFVPLLGNTCAGWLIINATKPVHILHQPNDVGTVTCFTNEK